MRVYFFKHLSKVILIGDYLIINLSVIAGDLYFSGSKSFSFTEDFTSQLLLFNIFWFIVSIFTKPYRSITIRDSSLSFNALTKSYFLFAGAILCYMYLMSFLTSYYYYKYIFSLLISIGFWMTFIRIVLFLLRKNFRIKSGAKYYSFNTILVGESHSSLSLLSNENLRWHLGIRGTYTDQGSNKVNRYLGDINKLFKDVETHKISNIIFCGDVNIDAYKKIVEIAEHRMVRIYMTPDFKYANLGSFFLDNNHSIPLLKLIPEPLSNPDKQFLKRFFDIIFSLLVIIFLLSWLIPLIAVIVKIESGGSVFFFQKRSGLKSKPFRCIKFRSMKSNSNADIKTVTKNDMRITKFGAFMRKTSIDELPQFINVFMGDMSIVGPRPHMLSQTDIYSKITKKYMTRHIVKPGITGWAQVMGSRGEIFTHNDMEKRIEKDIWYIQNWSFFLDVKIIFLTLYNIVRGDEQAY